MDEQIVLVDKEGKPIGTGPKLASHHAHTPFHLAFSCYIFNEKGEFLLTQRAHVKKVWPDVWTNSVCGHPAPNESMANAVSRRLDYELGIKEAAEPTLILPKYSYTTPPYKGIVENEFCPIFVTTIPSDLEFQPNPDEVENYKWVDWRQLLNDLEKNPAVYSYWIKDQVGRLMKSQKFLSYIN